MVRWNTNMSKITQNHESMVTLHAPRPYWRWWYWWCTFFWKTNFAILLKVLHFKRPEWMFKFVYRGWNRTSSLDFAPNEMRSVYFDIQFWVKQLNYSLKKKRDLMSTNNVSRRDRQNRHYDGLIRFYLDTIPFFRFAWAQPVSWTWQEKWRF